MRRAVWILAVRMLAGCILPADFGSFVVELQRGVGDAMLVGQQLRQVVSGGVAVAARRDDHVRRQGWFT